MKITAKMSNIKTIRYGEPDFVIHDGIMMSNRAGFEINPKCPTEYRQVIAMCLDLGWLRPVAYMTQHEHFMEKLSQ